MFIKEELLTDYDELKPYRTVGTYDIIDDVCFRTDLEFTGIGKRRYYDFETNKFRTADQIAFVSKECWNKSDIKLAITEVKNILKPYCWSISVMELRQQTFDLRQLDGIMIIACLNPWKPKNKTKKTKK